MKPSKTVMVFFFMGLLFALTSCSPTTSEKDVIGKWQNTKIANLWMEFYPDMTSTGGKWSITKDGQIKVVNADGAERIGILKEGKLIFAEFGERGVFIKEGSNK